MLQFELGNFATIFDKCDTKLKPLDYTVFTLKETQQVSSAHFFSVFTLLTETQDTKTYRLRWWKNYNYCPKAKRSLYGLRGKINISEVSKFSILPYTQNWELGDLRNMSFSSNSDSSYNSRLKKNKIMN